MSDAKVLTKVKEGLGDLALGTGAQYPNQAFLTVPVDRIVEACRVMHQKLGGRFVTCSGVDTRDAIEVLYHFCFDTDHYTVTLKTAAPKPFPTIETVTGVVPAAEWIEREMMDLLGLTVANHPKPERLILSDDWPEGVYPLRRGYRHEQ